MAKLPVVNRYLAGTVVLTQDVVRNDGTIARTTIEKHEHQGMLVGFQFIVNGCTNYVAYPTIRKAINAAAKTTC